MRALLVALAVAVGVWAVAVAVLYAFGRGVAAKELARLIPNLVTLLRGLARDERIPRRTRRLLWLAVAWVASPVDLVPEFIPVVGPLDDVVVVALVLRRVIRRAGPQIVADHWRGGDAGLHTVFRLAGVADT